MALDVLCGALTTYVMQSAAHAFTQLAQARTSSLSTDTEVPNAVHLPTLPGGVSCPSKYMVALQSFIIIVTTVYGHIDEFKKDPNDGNRALVGEYATPGAKYRCAHS